MKTFTDRRPSSGRAPGPSPTPVPSTDGHREPPAGPAGSYLLKRALLGRPLATSRLEHERLGKPTALAVFSSDNM